MYAYYGARGYRQIVLLLACQAAAFAGMMLGSILLNRYALEMDARALIAPRAAMLLPTLGFSLYTLRTWSSLSEAIFCLDIPYWQRYYTLALRPLIVLACLSWLLSIASSTAPLTWVSTLPTFVNGLGLFACVAGLAHLGIFYRMLRGYHGFQQTLLADLQRQHGVNDLSRVADSLAHLRGSARDNPFQMKRGLMLVDLASEPWHSRDRFPWAAQFERAFAEIRAEALRACESKKTEPYFYPGAIQGEWNVFWLVRRGEPLAEAEAQCPATFAALKAVPGFPAMREAHFSILRPRSRILPHCDASNAWLTAHFALQVPEGCALRVGRTQRAWKEGEFLFFDTSYEHEARNDSDRPRIVLLFDFLNPALNDIERRFYTVENSPNQ